MTRVTFTGLTDEEKIFIDEYLLTLDYVHAAMRIGTKKPYARSKGWTILQRPHIKKEIEARLLESHMSVNEALRRQADIARGDIGDFLAIAKDDFSIDLREAEKLGLTRLIKRVKSKKTFINGGKNRDDKEIYLDEIELYPADVAQERILKIAGVFKDGGVQPTVTGSNFTIPAHMIAPSFVNLYRDITQKLHTEYVLRGGRGSAKSSFISEVITMLLRGDPQAHALALRQVADTLRDSVYAQFLWAINQLGLTGEFHCTTSPMEITYLPTGQKIYFRGADDPAKIKSITPTFGYIKYVWFNELDQFHGQNAIRTVEQSVRGGDDIVYFKDFNP